jgi:hypothetical protein
MTSCNPLSWCRSARTKRAARPAIGRPPAEADNRALRASKRREASYEKTSLTVAVVSATLLWAQVAHAQRFTDNGDGTVTDHQTGLMWEKKTPAGSGGVHDVNNKQTWCNGPDIMTCTNKLNLADGTVFTLFLAWLNNGASDGTGCFANHCDWRMPSITELQSIFDRDLAAYCPTGATSGPPPCIDPAFGPTQLQFYWSATARASKSIYVRGVSFGNGGNQAPKPSGWYVRAVRSDCQSISR